MRYSIGAGRERLEGEAEKIFGVVILNVHDGGARGLMDHLPKDAVELGDGQIFGDDEVAIALPNGC